MKLQAKDLRFGNKLLFSPKWKEPILPREVVVMEIAEKFCFVKDLGVMMNLSYTDPELSPIPLTEEWLRRGGFKKEDSSNVIYTKNIVDFGLKKLCVFGYENGFGTGLIDNYSFKEKTETLPVHLDAVHQLQNLYFALTGEEIEFNQTP